jgi:hypothetical protein
VADVGYWLTLSQEELTVLAAAEFAVVGSSLEVKHECFLVATLFVSSTTLLEESVLDSLERLDSGA